MPEVHVVRTAGPTVTRTFEPMPRRQQWIVESLDERVARVEIDGEASLSIPRSLLPAAAREGSVLVVQREPDGRDRVTLTIAIDEEATASALEASRAQVAEIERQSKKRDPGGDVVL